MKRFFTIAALTVLALLTSVGSAAQEYSWKAKWISKEQCLSEANTWLAFRKDVTLDKVPESLVARIAADSKYWLWINDELVVFENESLSTSGTSYHAGLDGSDHLCRERHE